MPEGYLPHAEGSHQDWIEDGCHFGMEIIEVELFLQNRGRYHFLKELISG